MRISRHHQILAAARTALDESRRLREQAREHQRLLSARLAELRLARAEVAASKAELLAHRQSAS